MRISATTCLKLGLTSAGVVLIMSYFTAPLAAELSRTLFEWSYWAIYGSPSTLDYAAIYLPLRSKVEAAAYQYGATTLSVATAPLIYNIPNVINRLVNRKKPSPVAMPLAPPPVAVPPAPHRSIASFLLRSHATELSCSQKRERRLLRELATKIKGITPIFERIKEQPIPLNADGTPSLTPEEQKACKALLSLREMEGQISAALKEEPLSQRKEPLPPRKRGYTF